MPNMIDAEVIMETVPEPWAILNSMARPQARTINSMSPNFESQPEKLVLPPDRPPASV